MTRYHIINKLIEKNNFKNYLEIGVCNPAYCFDQVACLNKDGVDPGLEYGENPVSYKLTSDLFFDLLDTDRLDKPKDYKWDVIFIDGLHISNQVQKDILNSLNHLNDGGYIVLHDVSPPSIFRAREDYEVNGISEPWNGTTWKAMYWVRTHRNDLQTCTVNTDEGIGIIRKGTSTPIPFENIFYEYNIMDSNRINDLGLIEVSDLDEWLSKK